jgi:AcrR family transcriptional regulator
MEYVLDMGRRERKRHDLHQSLLVAGSRLFKEQGIARTTVDDIAAAVDVARQTFFNHFPYKEALVLELGADGMRKLAQRAHAMLEASCPAIEVLRRSAELALEYALEDAEVAVVVARELQHSDADRSLRAAHEVPMSDIFEAILVQAREEGAVREDLPIQIVAERLSGIMTSILANVLTSGPDHLRKELDVCFDMVFNGIRNRSR